VSDTDTISTEQPAQDAEQPAGAPAASVKDAGAAPSDGGANGAPARRRGLTGMVLAELRALAGQLNISGTTGMRKSELISAIKERQGAGDAGRGPSEPQGQLDLGDASAPASSSPASSAENGAAPTVTSAVAPTRRRRSASRPAGAPASTDDQADPSPSSADTERPAERASTSPAAAPADTVPESVNAGQAPEQGTSADGDDERRSNARTSEDAGNEQRIGTDGGEQRSRRERRREGGTNRDGGSDSRDAGNRDSGNRDTGNRDSGNRDTGNRDSGNRDTGNRDAGNRDAGNRDTGNRDAGNRDTGNRDAGNRDAGNRDAGNRDSGSRDGGNRDGGNDRDSNRDGGNNRQQDNRGNRERDRDNGNNGNNRQQDNQNNRDDDDDDGTGRGRRGRRFRDRNRRGRDRRDGPVSGGSPGGGVNSGPEPEVREDDVLLPVAGILDVLDNYAFVRTSGYLSGPNDVYVSLSMVRRYGLRRGDNVSGAVRQPREGEQQRQKFNPLVRVDSVNNQDPELAKNRPEFTKLTPLYPNERLRLETESHKLTTRVIDLVMPVGKGQRALIVSPPKAGKTTIMQNIANAITTNNPECHLMVVLVDERPEEVTDMQRSVKGEVIASTFDRPPTDHTTVAELSIERAKRLVELGHDVVVLLDNITRLGRAYNLAAPASGRILSGGVDSTALYPPKRFLGAARNIEDGGSLTIFATALVETGSTMDTVIFEEFKGTGNAELKLDRKIADKRVFPAIDVGDSGTRKEELLMSPDEHAVMVKLRRVLSSLDDQQAIDLLLTQLRKTRTNIEFLMQVAKSTPGQDD
jgi:transcription termination factor Rho